MLHLRCTTSQLVFLCILLSAVSFTGEDPELGLQTGGGSAAGVLWIFLFPVSEESLKKHVAWWMYGWVGVVWEFCCCRSWESGSELWTAGQQSTTTDPSSAAAVDDIAKVREALQRRSSDSTSASQHKHQGSSRSDKRRDLATGRKCNERTSMGANKHRRLHACNAVQLHHRGRRGSHSLSGAHWLSCPGDEQSLHSSRESGARFTTESLDSAQSGSLGKILSAFRRRFQQQLEHYDASAARFPLAYKLSLHGERLSLLRLQCQSRQRLPRLRVAAATTQCSGHHGHQHGIALHEPARRAARRCVLGHGTPWLR